MLPSAAEDRLAVRDTADRTRLTADTAGACAYVWDPSDTGFNCVESKDSRGDIWHTAQRAFGRALYEVGVHLESLTRREMQVSGLASFFRSRGVGAKDELGNALRQAW